MSFIERYVVTSGSLADFSKLEDSATATVQWQSGPHAGHLSDVISHKYNCGGCSQLISCECGGLCMKQEGGCWQHHSDYQEGDAHLSVW